MVSRCERTGVYPWTVDFLIGGGIGMDESEQLLMTNRFESKTLSHELKCYTLGLKNELKRLPRSKKRTKKYFILIRHLVLNELTVFIKLL